MNHIYGNLWFIPPFTTAWLTLLACLVLDLDLFPWTFWIPSPNPTWRLCPRPNVGNSCGFHIQERLNYIEHDQAAELYTTYINLQQYTIHPNPLHDLRLQWHPYPTWAKTPSINPHQWRTSSQWRNVWFANPCCPAGWFREFHVRIEWLMLEFYGTKWDIQWASYI